MIIPDKSGRRDLQTELSNFKKDINELELMLLEEYGNSNKTARDLLMSQVFRTSDDSEKAILNIIYQYLKQKLYQFN